MRESLHKHATPNTDSFGKRLDADINHKKLQHNFELTQRQYTLQRQQWKLANHNLCYAQKQNFQQQLQQYPRHQLCDYQLQNKATSTVSHAPQLQYPLSANNSSTDLMQISAGSHDAHLRHFPALHYLNIHDKVNASAVQPHVPLSMTQSQTYSRLGAEVSASKTVVHTPVCCYPQPGHCKINNSSATPQPFQYPYPTPIPQMGLPNASRNSHYRWQPSFQGGQVYPLSVPMNHMLIPRFHPPGFADVSPLPDANLQHLIPDNYAMSPFDFGHNVRNTPNQAVTGDRVLVSNISNSAFARGSKEADINSINFHN